MPPDSTLRTALLAAARRVFEQRGLQAHMSEIAASAGVAKAHIYNFFRNKDQLYLAVHRRAVLDAMAGEAQAVEQRPDRRAQLEALARYLLDAGLGHDQVRRLPLDLCERALHDAELQEDLVDARAEIHERGRQLLVRAGLMPMHDLAAGRRAAVLVTCLLSCLPMVRLFDPSLAEPQVLTELLDRMLAPPAEE